MQSILKIILGLLSLLFLVFGAAFMFAPNMIIEMFALEPAKAADPALAWSTVRGDMGALFLTLGAALGLGTFTQNRTWLYAAMLLMGLVFVGRAVGVAIHGGNQQIFLNMGVEAATVALIWLYARGLD